MSTTQSRKFDHTVQITNPVVEKAIKIFARPPMNLSRRQAIATIISKSYIAIAIEHSGQQHVLLLNDPEIPMIQKLIESGRLKSIEVCNTDLQNNPETAFINVKT